MVRRGIVLSYISALALLGGANFYSPSAAATTITFDDLSDDGSGTQIANGYQALNWTNWFVLNTPTFTSASGSNGFAAGTVSAPNVAFNGFGDTAITSDNIFTLTSAYLTAAWRDDLQVTMTGKLLGVTIHMATFSPSAIAPTLEVFNWDGIDEVNLFSTGGTQHPGYSGDGTEVAMDNLTINESVVVPEPRTLVILVGVLATFVLFGRRRRGRVIRVSEILGRTAA
jgi:hypothetical protein